MDYGFGDYGGGPGLSALGVDGPITTQGEITYNVTVNGLELTQRRTNASANPDHVWPGGGEEELLKLSKNEWVFSWRRPKHPSQRRVGQSQIEGFTSFNGVYIGAAAVVEEIEGQLWFVGQNKVDYVGTSDEEIPNGIACIAYGSGTVKYNGQVNTYPGDEIMWYLPPLHTKTSQYKPPQHTGKPRRKLTALMKPLDFKDLDYQIDDIFFTMMNENDGGVFNSHINELSDIKIKRNKKKTAALSMKKHILMTLVRGIESLQIRGIITINTPEKYQQSMAERTLLNDLFKLVGNNVGFHPTQTGKSSLVTSVQDLGEVDTIINNALEDYKSAQRTDVSAYPAPVGVGYREWDQDLGRMTHGLQFIESNEFFKQGLHWAKQKQLYALGTNSFVQHSTVQELRKKRADSMLWLSYILGVVGDQGHVENGVVKDVLKYVCVNYLPTDEATNYYPDFKGSDPVRGSSNNKFIVEYTRNSFDHWLDYEQGISENRKALTRKVVGVSSSFGTRGRDQKIDIVYGATRA